MVARKKIAKGRVYIRSEYLECVYEPKRLRRTIRRTVTALRNLRKRTWFDAVAFRGSSGAAVAYAASAELGIPLLHVRKGGSHCHLKVEGARGVRTYVILDDFIDSGNTVRAIVKEVRRELSEPVLVAVVLYASYGSEYLRERLDGWVPKGASKDCRVIGLGM